MTKAVLTIVLAIGFTAVAEEKLGDRISNDLDKAGNKIEAAFDGKKSTKKKTGEKSTGDKVSDDLDKTGDKIESAFDGKKTEGTTEAKVSDNLDKTGDKVEGSVEKGANKTKKAYRKAKDEVCETVNGKLKCVKQKVKHSVKNAEDEAKSEVKK